MPDVKQEPASQTMDANPKTSPPLPKPPLDARLTEQRNPLSTRIDQLS
jgi:hypothetical protein